MILGLHKFLPLKPKHGDGTSKFSAQVHLETHLYLARNLYAPDCRLARNCYLQSIAPVFLVLTTVGLVLTFFDITRVCIMRILHFFDTSRVWVLEDYFIFDTISVYIYPKTFLPRYTHPSINRVLEWY